MRRQHVVVRRNNRQIRPLHAGQRRLVGTGGGHAMRQVGTGQPAARAPFCVSGGQLRQIVTAQIATALFDAGRDLRHGRV